MAKKPKTKRSWNDISISERDELLDLYEAGGDLLAKHYDKANIRMKLKSLEAKLREHRNYKKLYLKNAAAEIDIPRHKRKEYLDFMEVEGDDWIIISDVEVPDHNTNILRAALLVAMKHNIKKLCIAGDLIATDMDALNAWVSTWVDPDAPTYEAAVDEVKGLLDAFSEWFEEIIIIEGNHDDRVARKTGGQVHLGMFLGENCVYSRYSFMWIWTTRGWVWVTHPKNYSRDPITLGQKLYDVQPRKGHVVVAHCHRRQDGHTKDGVYEVHALGTCRDPWRTKYKSKAATNHPQWDESFLMIKDGFHYPFDMRTTNWAFWLGEDLAEELDPVGGRKTEAGHTYPPTLEDLITI